MAKEVSCGPISFIINYVEKKGIPFHTWHNGIHYNVEHLHNVKERVEWSVLCQLFKNIKPYFTDDDFKEMGRELPKGKFNKTSLVVIKLLYAKVGLLRFMRDYLQKPINQNFNCFNVKFEAFGNNGVRQIVYLREGYEFCREFCFLVYGTQLCLLNHLGHKKFKIDLKLTKNAFINEINCAERKPILSQIKDLILFPFNARAAAIELDKAHQDLLERYQEIDNARIELQKQKTQLETVYEICRVIHKNLELEDTLEAVAKALVEIASFTYAKIKLLSDLEGNSLLMEKCFGSFQNSDETICMNLIISDKIIGEVITNIPQETNNKSAREILNLVLPIISMTIDDALIHRTVVDYQTNLERKVENRTIELKEARDDLEETVDLLKQAKSARDRFFANISHEFRTPLTLIFGPANDVLDKSDDLHTKKNVEIIKRNASRLYSLVNQLLDLSRLESGKMKLEAREQNIIPLLKEIFLLFSSYAAKKKITLKFKTIEKHLNVYIDKDKLEKIVNNLLSNALKFTPEGGNIDFTVEKLMNDVGIRITDNGIGISEERIEKIFDRFYQVENSSIKINEGAGIGLALTKELVELHKGKIEATSKEGEGTTFTVKLPIGKDHLKPEEIAEKQVDEEFIENDELPELQQDTENRKERTDIEVSLEPDLSARLASAGSDQADKTDNSLLLIVEDNSDVRGYIKSHLEEDYRTLEALDGEDGLNQATKHMPDLIISDVMMPKMDGFELCNRLKTDERTSHIPIIMLTAKATSKDKIEGYETGADDYIMKPFDIQELRIRINNMIEQRKRLREHFRKESLFVLDDKNITKTDKDFLKKVVGIIHKHLSETAFGVDSFAEEIGLSRSQLHRKLIALVGEPPGDLIRRVRLTASAKLIKEDFGNISEIAVEVGFSNPSNFAQCFRKQFGVSPSEYKYHPIN